MPQHTKLSTPPAVSPAPPGDAASLRPALAALRQTPPDLRIILAALALAGQPDTQAGAAARWAAREVMRKPNNFDRAIAALDFVL